MNSMETSRSVAAQAFWNDLQFESAVGAPWDERPVRAVPRPVAPASKPHSHELPAAVSSWTLSPARRALDFCVAAIALVLFAPILAVIALCVRLTSAGPIIFRQERVGREGELFTIYKFRTMEAGPREAGPRRKGLSVTRHGDHRITRVGAVLRRYKLDELPQLVNVLLGDMSLVGPRPKLPDHHHNVSVPFRPGITGAATLVFRREEEMLRHIPENELEDFCLHVLTPYKAKLDLEYARKASLASDER
jgi:lipopolysaccharide/colanic/teichoic acid biosynthesis glycosyltransferase